MSRRVSAVFVLSIAWAGLLIAALGAPSLRAQDRQEAGCEQGRMAALLAHGILPSFEGCRVDVAKAWLAERGFEPPTIELEANPDVPEQIIFDQRPEPGTRLYNANTRLRIGLTLRVSSGPPPKPSPDQFSVADAGTVEEGKPLIFTITRNASDRPAEKGYVTRPTGEAGEAAAGTDFKPVSGTIAFPPGETSRTVTVETLAVPGKGGDRRVHLFLTAPGEQAIVDEEDEEGVGIIRDRPAPAFALSENVAAPGDPPRFMVARTGSTEKYSLEVTAFRDDRPWGGPVSLDFADGQMSAEILPGGAECARSVEIRIRDPLSLAVIEPASMSLTLVAGPSCAALPPPPPPPPPAPPPEPGANRWLWGLAALVLLVAAPLIWWKLKRPSPPPPAAPPLVPAAACAFGHGECRIVDQGGVTFAAPPFRMGVEVRPGGVVPPDVLPFSKEESSND